MAKYLLIYRDQLGKPNEPSEAEMQAFLALWGEWFAKFPGAIVDGGDALLPTGRVISPEGVVSDGPYVEAKEMIGGFSVLQADNYDAAVAIARECPISKIGGAIEVREFAGLG